MSRSLYLALMAGLFAVFAQSAFAAEVTKERTVKGTGKPGVVSVVTTTEKVEIVAVDQAKRTVKLKTSDGEVGTYKVSKEVRNLAQVKAGDILKAKEVERLEINARKVKGHATYTQSYTFERAPKGAKPGFVATERIKISGTVQLVRYDQRRLIVTGPAGKTKSFDIAPDVENLQQVKPGDLVVVDYTDALSITVEAPKK